MRRRARITMILVVAGDPALRSALSHALGLEECEVLSVEGIAAAEAALAAYAPDLVLVHASLPDGSGVELIRDLRRRADGRMCIVLLSGREASAGEALMAGADDHVGIPYAPETLVRACGAALERMGKGGSFTAGGASSRR